MQNVVGPTLVAMATKFGLGAEIQSPTGLCKVYLDCLYAYVYASVLRLIMYTGMEVLSLLGLLHESQVLVYYSETVIKQLGCCLFATELIAFPAGGIAAIVIGTVVVVMVVVKVICVITGYERRLPNVDLDYDNDDDEQHKQIVYERQSVDGASSVVEHASNVAHADSDDVISATPG